MSTFISLVYDSGCMKAISNSSLCGALWLSNSCGRAEALRGELVAVLQTLSSCERGPY
ncbi:unnamed protein product [Mycena citricolor]|uniref:Uncharacterized protein n=1 Tax=Mycena citricolor TaxID=2018698 RepID=A0AAD2H2R7_9AGAR|nr:unnamed protein product [Mycena citricolor]